ncbi:MAG: aminotransferase class I/II-fold pyridoxal phosphate-dependent enzyme, partial [Chitinophagales bacterium]
LTHSGTGALEMIALMLNLTPEDEIILPSFTFVSTANAFARQGAKLVFVDIEKDTLGVDPFLVEKAITPKTKAIICMHYAGHSCQIEELKKISQKHNLILIEDAALCYGKNHLGTQGDFGMISFDVTKHISSTQGGLLIINNSDYVARAKKIYHIGTNREEFMEGNVPYYEWVDIGSKFQMAETNAAVLSAQLKEEETILSKLKTISQWYHEQLNDYSTVKKIEESKIASNFHEYYVICSDKNERDNLSKHLKSNGIESLFHYIPLHNAKFCKDRYSYVGNNNTQEIADQLLRLPFHTHLSHDDIKYICTSIKSFFNG